MLRQDPSSSTSSDRNGAASPSGTAPAHVYGEAGRVGGVDVSRELNKLEEMILDSPRIPLSRRTLVDEEMLLDQLDLIRINLPTAFQEATEVLRQKEEILLEAEQYAQEIIETAERRAAQILDETNLLRQAELEVQQIRQQVQQECEAAQEQTMAEIERLRRQTQQEMEELRRRAIAECEEVQQGADVYADRVLDDMEQQFTEMLRVIRNGRQRLRTESSAAQKGREGESGQPRPTAPTPRPQDRSRKSP